MSAPTAAPSLALRPTPSSASSAQQHRAGTWSAWIGLAALIVCLMADMLSAADTAHAPVGAVPSQSLATSSAEPPAALPLVVDPAEPRDEAERERRSAAVALNYSRAALHRIRKTPTYRVLHEEQEKILNHLNLNGVADEDVLRLYSAVLDEINQVHLADAEKQILDDKANRALRSALTINAFNLAAQVATAQYVSAIRTGASSWWDYRVSGITNELDSFRVERQRLSGVVAKSTQFLDISWKMARTRQIPDRWLVRSDDLDRLETAWREPDPGVRLRLMRRMEPFMTCYPPYWYYLARTQQALGQLNDAEQTYQRLEALGAGHFRKDEMLAAGLANRAMILAYLGQPGAAETALAALEQSTDVWEANLVCATVLQNSARYDTAEDAILRNLDAHLEQPRSEVALLSLYYQSDQTEKLARRLSDPRAIASVPAPVLVQCALKLGREQSPPALLARLDETLSATPRLNFGRDDIVISANQAWQFEQARVTLQAGSHRYENPRLLQSNDSVLLCFDGIAEFGGPLQSGGTDVAPLSLLVEYPATPPLRIDLASAAAVADLPARDNGSAAASTSRPTKGRASALRIVSFIQSDGRLSLRGPTRNDSRPGSANAPALVDGTSRRPRQVGKPILPESLGATLPGAVTQPPPTPEWREAPPAESLAGGATVGPGSPAGGVHPAEDPLLGSQPPALPRDEVRPVSSPALPGRWSEDSAAGGSAAKDSTPSSPSTPSGVTLELPCDLGIEPRSEPPVVDESSEPAAKPTSTPSMFRAISPARAAARLFSHRQRQSALSRGTQAEGEPTAPSPGSPSPK